jgi:deazaflavin-dependent oxidoreductase (nitroreductase family)
VTAAERMPLFVRLATPFMTRLLARGVTIRPLALLTVRGRSTGRHYTAPVAVLERAGQFWVAALFGEVGWTRNLRAAGQAMLIQGRSRATVDALELVSEAAGRVLKDAVAPAATPHLVAWVLRRYLRVTPGASLDEFVAAAQGRPVFQLTSPLTSEIATPPLTGDEYEFQRHPHR